MKISKVKRFATPGAIIRTSLQGSPVGVIQADYVGQKCRVGDAPPYDWYEAQSIDLWSYEGPEESEMFTRNGQDKVSILTGNLYSIGDSQTAGANSNHSSTVSNMIAEQYRWVNLFAQSEGKNLTVVNLGRPGQKISDPPAFAELTTWHAFGSVPENWQGVMTLMLGYNNTGGTPEAPKFFEIMERAFSAFVARALIEKYAGIGLSGLGSSGNAQDSFITTGTEAVVAVDPGQSMLRTAFYTGNPNAQLRTIVLTSGQYVQFSALNKKAIALFLRSSPFGGSYTVSVNGKTVDSGSTVYQNVGGGDQNLWEYPLVSWIENLESSSIVRITATSGSVIWQAYGSIPKTGSISNSKQIILAASTGNQNFGRSDRLLQELNFRARYVCNKFSNYPVHFADVYSNWDRYEDDQYGDESHFTEKGNIKVAKAFASAGKSRTLVATAPITEKSILSAIDDFVEVNMDPATWGVKHSQNGGIITSPCSNIAIRTGPAASSQVVVDNESNGGAGDIVRPSYLGSTVSHKFINWRLPFRMSLALNIQNQTSTATGYVNLGKPYNSNTFGQMAQKGVGLKIEGTNLKAQVFGSSLITSPTIAALVSDFSYFVVIDYKGEGVCDFYVNNVLVWSTSAGPTGDGFGNCNGIEIAGDNGANTDYFLFTVKRIKVIYSKIKPRY